MRTYVFIVLCMLFSLFIILKWCMDSVKKVMFSPFIVYVFIKRVFFNVHHPEMGFWTYNQCNFHCLSYWNDVWIVLKRSFECMFLQFIMKWATLYVLNAKNGPFSVWDVHFQHEKCSFYGFCDQKGHFFITCCVFHHEMGYSVCVWMLRMVYA